jgi:DNA-binding NtrC family response regulator
MVILIIDDDRSICEIYSAYISQLGHEVVVKYNATDALCFLVGGKVDVVLLDMMLPDIGGSELLHVFKDLRMPVIVISGLSRDSIMTLMLKDFGIVGVLQKPIVLSDMQKVLKDVKSDGMKGFV